MRIKIFIEIKKVMNNLLIAHFIIDRSAGAVVRCPSFPLSTLLTYSIHSRKHVELQIAEYGNCATLMICDTHFILKRRESDMKDTGIRYLYNIVDKFTFAL